MTSASSPTPKITTSIDSPSLIPSHTPQAGLTASASAAPIPVARPQLPQTLALIPYLRQLDDSRIYSNHGPLVQQLGDQIGACLGLGAARVLCCASGTMALIGAIRAVQTQLAHPGRLCLVPAYTFVATAAAVQTCGYDCHLVDVRPDTWAVDPDALLDHPRLNEVGLVVPVAPYGRPLDLAAWQSFSERTGIPVVIDAAACLDGFVSQGADIPEGLIIAVSLHATKALSSGEGGLVISRSDRLARAAYRALNFGYSGAPEAQTAGINGKQSEYHAAVGLAELATADQKIARWRGVSSAYQDARPDTMQGQLWTAPRVSGCYALYEAPSAMVAQAVLARLQAAQIGTRFWYKGGVHTHHAYRDLPRDALVHTDDIGARLLGLPCFVDMTPEQVARVVALLD